MAFSALSNRPTSHPSVGAAGCGGRPRPAAAAAVRAAIPSTSRSPGPITGALYTSRSLVAPGVGRASGGKPGTPRSAPPAAFPCSIPLHTQKGEAPPLPATCPDDATASEPEKQGTGYAAARVVRCEDDLPGTARADRPPRVPMAEAPSSITLAPMNQ